MKCCICNKEIPVEKLTGWDRGNDAGPVKNGRCCNSCNFLVVIPARFKQVNKKKEE